MTKDEMIELAKQAGWQYAHGDSGYEPLWAFANLVAAKEREACAKLCDELPAPNVYSDSDKGVWDIASLACGDAIRTRGEQA